MAVYPFRADFVDGSRAEIELSSQAGGKRRIDWRTPVKDGPDQLGAISGVRHGCHELNEVRGNGRFVRPAGDNGPSAMCSPVAKITQVVFRERCGVEVKRAAFQKRFNLPEPQALAPFIRGIRQSAGF